MVIKLDLRDKDKRQKCKDKRKSRQFPVLSLQWTDLYVLKLCHRQ